MQEIQRSEAMSETGMLDPEVDNCNETLNSRISLVTTRMTAECARCRNHGFRNLLKGHKMYCEFRYCSCDKCRLTVNLRKIMATQTAMRRAQAQDEARANLHNELPSAEDPQTSFTHNHESYSELNHPSTLKHKNETTSMLQDSNQPFLVPGIRQTLSLHRNGNDIIGKCINYLCIHNICILFLHFTIFITESIIFTNVCSM